MSAQGIVERDRPETNSYVLAVVSRLPVRYTDCDRIYSVFLRVNVNVVSLARVCEWVSLSSDVPFCVGRCLAHLKREKNNHEHTGALD